MTLAPIRGAPPDAPIPDFPIVEPKAAPAAAVPEQAKQPVQRQRGSPVGIGALSFQVDPELPAIRRGSMTIHVFADASDFLRMSADRARRFLTDLRDGRSPLVATGDEGGTMQITYETTETGAVFLLSKPGEGPAYLRCTIDQTFDMTLVADELLADLGA